MCDEKLTLATSACFCTSLTCDCWFFFSLSNFLQYRSTIRTLQVPIYRGTEYKTLRLHILLFVYRGYNGGEGCGICETCRVNKKNYLNASSSCVSICSLNSVNIRSLNYVPSNLNKLRAVFFFLCLLISPSE